MGDLENLATFLRDQLQSTDEQKHDWDVRRQEFVAAAQDLLSQVQDLLRPLADQGLVRFVPTTAELSEWHAGRYTAPGLVASLGSAEVRLTPVGAEIAGAYGRVDLEGPQGEVPLLWLPAEAPGPGPNSRRAKDIKRTWRLAVSAPRAQYIELNRDSLSSAIMGVLGG